MKFTPINLVNVFLKFKQDKVYVGRLATKDRKIYFEYNSDFLNLNLNLSPFKLPLKSGIIEADNFIFDGLFGIFNDSLPDGWGRLLLDRKLAKYGINSYSISPLDRLCFIGKNGMGALHYEPEVDNNSIYNNINLDLIAEEIREFQENNNDNYVEELIQLGGSSSGARPKVLLNIDNENWIIKFRSILDPLDIGNIEYAYYLMAKEAGIIISNSKLFPSKSCSGYFGTTRFDRFDNQSLHMHTASGLLNADHRLPSLDYKSLIQATMYLTHDIRECEKLFRICVFNILMHNMDDHSKNFSYLMNNKGEWKLAPAYDLTFSFGPGGEHCTMVIGKGKDITVNDLLKLAEVCNINSSFAKSVIEKVKEVQSRWPYFAEIAKVSKSSKNMIQNILKDN